MNNYKVYIHISPSNKVYIGITKQNPVKRWGNGRGYRNNIYFYRSILKYGWNNFTHQILYDNLSLEDAKSKEIELICKYNSTDTQFGYNRTKGGDYRLPIPEKIRQIITQKLTGIKRTDEQKEHYRLSAMKRPKRVKLSEEHKRNISKSLLNNKRAVGNTKNRIKVLQFSLDNQFIKEFSCAKFAAEEVNCCASGINRCCRENLQENLTNTKYKGKYKGYKWYYKIE